MSDIRQPHLVTQSCLACVALLTSLPQASSTATGAGQPFPQLSAHPAPSLALLPGRLWLEKGSPWASYLGGAVPAGETPGVCPVWGDEGSVEGMVIEEGGRSRIEPALPRVCSARPIIPALPVTGLCTI